MKVLFIADDFSCDPLGIAWLSAYLKDAGHETDIATPAEAMCRNDEPDMLCYSVTTGNHAYYRKANNLIRLRFPGAVSVFGGPHVTFFPEYIEGYSAKMDLGVRGEGFQAIVDIANAIEKGYDGTVDANVVYSWGMNQLRPLMPKDGMLLPDRDIIYRKNRDKPIKSIMASFGCPMSCAYCYNKAWKRLYDTKRTQIRPVQDVMAEIKDLRNNYPVELLYFEDDVFPVYDKEWLDEFCDSYDKFPFHIHLRAEYINEDRIWKLKQVGLHSVTYAIESGDDTLRRTILNRNMSEAMILKAAGILHKYGINFRTQNMIGIPYETWDTALKTLALNIKCNPTMGWASVYQPYPGTELGDLCIENGWFDGELDSITSSFFDRYRLNVRYGRRFERLQKLFGFAVRHPRLGNSVVPFMARLPFRYKRLHNRYKKKLNRELYELDL